MLVFVPTQNIPLHYIYVYIFVCVDMTVVAHCCNILEHSCYKNFNFEDGFMVVSDMRMHPDRSTIVLVINI